MPRMIVKLTEGDKSWYLEWTTVSDSPRTWGMSLEDFKQSYKEEHGRHGMYELEERLKRVEEKGTSSLVDNSAEEVIRHNRAGKNETCLSKQQIIDFYCKHPLTDNSTQEEVDEYEKKIPEGKRL